MIKTERNVFYYGFVYFNARARGTSARAHIFLGTESCIPNRGLEETDQLLKTFLLFASSLAVVLMISSVMLITFTLFFGYNQ